MPKYELVEDSSSVPTDEPFDAPDWETAAAHILTGMGYRLMEVVEEEVKTIKIPIHNITLTLVKGKEGSEDKGRYTGGSISSELKEVCYYCDDSECNMDCEKFTKQLVNDPEGMQIRRENFVKFNSMMDALESLILAHAIAGVDVETPAYQEGIETVIDACVNQTDN